MYALSVISRTSKIEFGVYLKFRSGSEKVYSSYYTVCNILISKMDVYG